MKFNQMTVMR